MDFLTPRIVKGARETFYTPNKLRQEGLFGNLNTPHLTYRRRLFWISSLDIQKRKCELLYFLDRPYTLVIHLTDFQSTTPQVLTSLDLCTHNC